MQRIIVQLIAAAVVTVVGVWLSGVSQDVAYWTKFVMVVALGTIIVLMQFAVRAKNDHRLLRHFRPEAQVFLEINGKLSLGVAVLSFFPFPLWGFVIANAFYYLVALGFNKFFRRGLVQFLLAALILLFGVKALFDSDIGQSFGILGCMLLVLSFVRLVTGQLAGSSWMYRSAYLGACVFLGLSAYYAGPGFRPYVWLEIALGATMAGFFMYDCKEP